MLPRLATKSFAIKVCWLYLHKTDSLPFLLVMTLTPPAVISLGISSRLVTCLTFPFETVQLEDATIGNSSVAIAFGNTPDPRVSQAKCKSFPGGATWPLDEEWAALNSSLEEALLKPTPLGAVCHHGDPSYDAARCRSLVRSMSWTRTLLDDPLTVLTLWP